MLVSSQSSIISIQSDNGCVNFFEILPPDVIKQLIHFMDAESQGNIYFLNESIRVVAINNVENLPLVLYAKQIVNALISPKCAPKRYTDKNDEERKTFKSEYIQKWFNWVSKKEVIVEICFRFAIDDLTKKCNWSDIKIQKLAKILGFDIAKKNDPYEPWKIYGRK